MFKFWSRRTKVVPAVEPQPERPKDYNWMGRPLGKLRRWRDTRSGKLWTLVFNEPRYYPKAGQQFEDKDRVLYRPTDETFAIYFESNDEECTEQCPECKCWLIPERDKYNCPVCRFGGVSPDYELYPTKVSK